MKKRSFGTHDGTFHADEVTACALLLLFGQIDEDKIVRSREPQALSCCEYVCDVGGIYDPALKRFDHHQVDYPGGLSSAGMILLYLQQQGVLSEPLYRFFNRSLILGVDAHDNGRLTPEVGVCTFSHIISNFLPPDYQAIADLKEKAFFEALHFAVGYLKRLLDRFNYIQHCRTIVEREMAKNQKVLFFDAPLQWLESFFDLGGEAHPALFVVMPSEGHWKLRGIPPSYADRMKVRKPLPEEWAGLQNGELCKASGIEGAIFCHKGRFMSVWESREALLQALDVVLKRSL